MTDNFYKNLSAYYFGRNLINEMITNNENISIDIYKRQIELADFLIFSLADQIKELQEVNHN